MRKKILLIVFSLLFFQITFAQVDIKKLTGEAVDYTKKKLVEHLKKSLQNYKVSDFNYAIVFGDNSMMYETKESFRNTRKVMLYLLDPESAKSKTPIEKIRDLNQTGEMFYLANKFKLAEASFRSALFMCKTYKLMNTNDAVRIMSNLGLLYSTTGQYTKAEEYDKMALKYQKDAGYAAVLNNMGVLYKDMGKFNEAEEFLVKAYEYLKKEKQFGANYSVICNNLGMFYQQMGRYDDAEKLLNEAISTGEKTLKSKSPTFVRFKVNLALLYQIKGDYEKSEKVLKEAIALKKKRLGTKHPDYAVMLRYLAALYMQMGKTDKAEPLLLKAVDINAKKFGKKHPSYAASLFDLAALYLYKNETQKAIDKLTKVYEIQDKTLGKYHLDKAKTSEYLAIAYWQKKDPNSALNYYTEAIDDYIYHIDEYFPVMNDYEKNLFWETIHPRFLRFFSFAAQNYAKIPKVITYMYNYQVSTKALLLNSSRKVKNTILESGNEQLINKYNQWLDTKRYLAKIYTMSEEDIQEQEINVDSVENLARNLEKELVKQSTDFAGNMHEKKIKFEDVSAILNDNEAVVEFVRIPGFDNLKEDTTLYYAAIVVKNNAEPQMVLFRNGNYMEYELIREYFEAVKTNDIPEKFYNNYWGKLGSVTASDNRIYVASDGIYNKINVNTLKAPDGKYLVESKEIIYLTNTKAVVGLKQKIDKNENLYAKTAFLVGFPDYLLDLPKEYAQVSPLPGTKVEIDKIAALMKSKNWNITTLTGKQASETNLKNVDNPFVLHIATHGFFLEDVYEGMDKIFGVDAIKAAKNPLLRSGLLFAGADKTMLDLNDINDNSDDGILNAYEAMMLKLSKTSLVVLSACQTGLGEIKSGEGVYGLQRAFQVAGAASIMISLWEVSDQGTQDLMSNFYSFWLKSGNKYSAFRNAQLKMKDKYKSPFFWGAFVLVNQ